MLRNVAVKLNSDSPFSYGAVHLLKDTIAQLCPCHVPWSLTRGMQIPSTQARGLHIWNTPSSSFSFLSFVLKGRRVCCHQYPPSVHSPSLASSSSIQFGDMAHFQSYYDNSGVRRTDEYGNPIRPGTDEHGNPVCPSSDPYGKLAGAPPATGHGSSAGHRKEHHTLGGMLHRSGSSSSSSSEDDGHGGRRKKGLKEKVKEKLPGQHDGDAQSHTAASTTPWGYHATGERHEKKGIMDKIKEKLPGGHHHH